jgi:hypothetical protein
VFGPIMESSSLSLSLYSLGLPDSEVIDAHVSF